MSDTLYERIQKFYDSSSTLWEMVWGEHMHHGYYGVTGREKKEGRIAQIDLIEELLKWSQVKKTDCFLDVGCGIGGSSLYLAEKFKGMATGITLSPVQASRAKERAEIAGLASRTEFKVADALNMPFGDNSFDLVWSLESGEHMPDKQKFMAECYRVLMPGGTLVVATWCHRPVGRVGWPLTIEEREHLETLYQVYCLPYTICLPEYREIAENLGFKKIKTADWSRAVAPFWGQAIASAFNPTALLGLLNCDWDIIRAALSMGLMSRGYQQGLIRFGLLRATK